LAKKNKLSVIDLHTLFGTDDTFVLSDGIHPNDKGVAKMAEIIAGEIQRNKSK
jgi:lysophospholipase L1-like esterase